MESFITSPRPVSAIASYHAHIYFRDAPERERAAWLRAELAKRFSLQLGRWHETPIGPHALPMYQVAFATTEFAALIPFLMLNRAGLTILIHPNTENPRRDHLVQPFWMGAVLDIMQPEQLPEASPHYAAAERIVPNTTPTLSP